MGEARPAPFVPLPSAVLHGYAAHVVYVVLEKHLASEVAPYSAERQAEAFAARRALRLASESWRAARIAEVTADRGNAAQARAAAPAVSDQLSTQELARMLGVKPRQARNVGRDHALGVQVGATWVWSRSATLAYLEQRETA